MRRMRAVTEVTLYEGAIKRSLVVGDVTKHRKAPFLMTLESIGRTVLGLHLYVEKRIRYYSYLHTR